MSDSDKNEQFLNRWSRRKLGEAEEETAPAIADEVTDDIVAQEDETAVTVDDLPDIDGLDKDSDFTVFMQPGVPEELRNLALRKLWQSDPVLANLDGLNDYDQDFSAIMQAGAEVMKRLADAGEKITRPGAEEDDRDKFTGDEEPEPTGDTAAGADETATADGTEEPETAPSKDPERG